MNTDRYEELIADNKVLKIQKDIGLTFFKHLNDNIVFDFTFYYRGDISEVLLPPEKRISISIFIAEKLIPEINYNIVEDNFILLVNANDKNYSLSYNININTHDRTVCAKILDCPTYGKEFVTSEEKEGLIVNY